MNIRVLFVKRPVGWVDESCFRIEACIEPVCGPQDVLVEALWLSLDPYLRGRMNAGPSYAPGFELDKPIVSRVVARVLASGHPRFREGDFVWGFLDWALRSVVPRGEGLTRIDPALGRPSLAISALGMPGLTAWVGAIELGKPSPGDTVYVSSAAGAVGQLAGQFARRAGAGVVGSAGSADKVAYLTGPCGFDAAFDYKTRDIDEALRALCPKGIDVYFDNVGGDHLTAAIEMARPMARFALCGMIAQYNETGTPTGPHNIIQAVGKQLKLQGFIVSTHADMQPAFLADMAKWIAGGQMKYEETVMAGIEKAPEAFLGLFTGANTGKMLVKIA